MAVVAHKLGPGHLTFGEAATEKEFGMSCPEVSLEPVADDGDTIVVLSGDELHDDPDETFTLTGTVYQEFSMDSLVIWAKENSGVVMPFVFVPASSGSLQITGRVKIKPVRIGGEVRTRNTSDFSFPGVGDWTPEAYTPETP